jgi:hypothetical protein
LLQHGVDQRGLTVVNVGNDGNVANSNAQNWWILSGERLRQPARYRDYAEAASLYFT